MTSFPAETPAPRQGLSRLQIAFVTTLLLIGVGFLCLSGYRALHGVSPPRTGPDLAQEAADDLEKRGFKPLSEPLERLLNDAAYKPIPTQVHPLLGQSAPDFTLNDVTDLPWRLSEQRAHGPVVLVFYFGYNCNHCVSQLFGLHKDVDRFRELGARIAAVSADPPDLTRQRFARYGAFAFPVLSDAGNKVAQSYGVYRPKTATRDDDLLHGTFVISREGKVVWANTGDEPFTEDQTLLIELARCEGRLPRP